MSKDDLDFGAMITAGGSAGPNVLQIRTQDVLPDAIGGLGTQALSGVCRGTRPGSPRTITNERGRARNLIPSGQFAGASAAARSRNSPEPVCRAKHSRIGGNCHAKLVETNLSSLVAGGPWQQHRPACHHCTIRKRVDTGPAASGGRSHLTLGHICPILKK